MIYLLKALAVVCVCCNLVNCSSAGPERPNINAKMFDSYLEASQKLKVILNENGYDTSEGDHAVGRAESYAAMPESNTGVELRVNTSWRTSTPLGSYLILEDVPSIDSELPISRLDAKGAWVDCGDFQFEFLSTAGFDYVLALQRDIREQMGC